MTLDVVVPTMFPAYVIPRGAQATKPVVDFVATDASTTPTAAERVSAIAAKYRAMRGSLPKQRRSGDPSIRLAQLEGYEISIREAENLRG